MPAIGNGFRVEIDVADVRRKMELLGVRLTTNVIRRALLSGARVIRDEARIKAPKRTGALKKAIVAETDRKGSTRDRLVAVVKIAPKSYTVSPKGRAKTVSSKVQKARGKRSVKGEVYPRAYAHLVEFGTRPHAVGKGSRLSKGRAGGAMHPGTPPQPFIRPAYDTKRGEASSKIIATLRQEFQKELTKLGQGTRRKAAS
ncbi:MAG: HK97 gp10 family phage protein [Phycisphaerales bacterium]|nr:MAG: HK97 gp10 family phage protein [Phycisphaerales bacterium]